MNGFFYPPVQTRGIAFLGLLLLALGILGGMIWRDLHRFDNILIYIEYSHRVQKLSQSLQQSLTDHLTGVMPALPGSDLLNAINEMDHLMQTENYLSPDTKTSLETAKSLIVDAGKLDQIEKNTRLIAALKVMKEALDNESLEGEKLLEDMNKTTEAELSLAMVTLACILLAAVIFLRTRILHPINDLRRLLLQLTEGNFTPISTDHIDPLLLPVFKSYNEMVTHLAELEEAKRLHAQSLRHEVRMATQTLLEQQHSLARAERLAAIGEVAAELAHEIRNPLAGIQIAFSNFRRETKDYEQIERLDLIGSELKRLAAMLNDMLNNSRHVPEPPQLLNLADLIRDLVVLARYQIAEAITLEIEAPRYLPVNLPPSEIRQVLLNLILNAADALDQKSGWICIKAWQDAASDCIEVTDSGPGFSKVMLAHGIRPFQTSRQQGTGLGLAMVQRFIKNMGGNIKLSNRTPHGACVCLILPKIRH